MSGHALPMVPSGERTWLFGLLAIVVLAGLGALAWLAVPSGTATFTVHADAAVGPMDVSVERLGDGGDTMVANETGSEGGQIYRTSQAGVYEVTIESAEGTCSTRVTLVRTDGKLELADMGLGARNCPHDLSVSVSPV